MHNHTECQQPQLPVMLMTKERSTAKLMPASSSVPPQVTVIIQHEHPQHSAGSAHGPAAHTWVQLQPQKHRCYQTDTRLHISLRYSVQKMLYQADRFPFPKPLYNVWPRCLLKSEKKEAKAELQVYHLNTVCQPFTKTLWMKNVFITVHLWCT